MVLRKFILQLIKCRSRFVFLLILFAGDKGLLGQINRFDPIGRKLIIDSLLIVLKNTNQDSIKVKALNDLAHQKNILSKTNTEADLEPAIKYADEALKLAQKINNKQQQAIAIGTQGSILRLLGNFPEALKMFFIALRISEEIGDKDETANQYYNIGKIYFDQGNFSEALKYHFTALKLKEEIGWESNLQLSYNWIGNIYYNIGNMEEAIKYFYRGLKTAKEQIDKAQIGVSYKGLGKVYMNKGNYTEALKFHFIALEIMEQRQSKYYLDECYIDIGNVYLKKASYTSIPFAKENYNKALYYFQKGLLLAKNSASKYKIINAYSGLAEAYNGIYDYKNALHYTLLHSQLKDSLFNNASYSKVTELKIQFEADKTAVLEKAKQEKIRAEKQQMNNLLLMGLILVVITSVFLFFYLHQRIQKIRAVEKVETIHHMAELEMQSLRSQLNPHFMFNALNSIQTLILKEETDKSHSYLSRFARLLRMLLENADKPFIPLRMEIDFLQLYLGLESLRVPDMQYAISTDPALNTEQTLIPNMFLQPYVENAIWHGLSHKETDKQLQIHIYRENGTINYEIEDNGVGRKKAEELKSLFRKQHQSKGMELINRRIKLLNKEYGSAIQTEITDVIKNNEVAGTRVTIKVPLKLCEPLQN